MSLFSSARTILVGLPVLVSCGNVTSDDDANPGRAPLCVGPHWEEIRVDSTSVRIEATHVKAGDGSVIVWGGIGWTGPASQFRTDGWRYFPDTGELRPLEGGPVLDIALGAAFGDDVLFAGGYALGGPQGEIARYSLANETWSTLAAPEPELLPVAATSDAWLLVSGESVPVRYSASTGTWTTLSETEAPMPSPWGGDLTVVGDQLWTWRDSPKAGNWDYVSHMPEALLRYDVATDHWTVDEAQADTKDSPTIVWLSALNRVAIFGGLLEDLHEPSNTGWLMDPTTGERTTMSPAPVVSARKANRTVIDGKSIFLFEEGAPDAPLGAIYDGVTDTWTTLDTECAPEYAESSIAIGGGRVLVWSNALDRETAHIYTP